MSYSAERRAIIQYLESDLYERQPDDNDSSGIWKSPLNWRVRISGKPNDPVVEIYWPDGRVYSEARPMRVEELQDVLP